VSFRFETAAIRNIAVSAGSVALALVVASVLIASAGGRPLDAYAGMFQTALGSEFAIGVTINKTIPRLLPALGIALALRAGLWNIGGEGQLYIGAAAATAVALSVPELPLHLNLILALLAGVAGGAAWGAIPGALRAYRGVNEVITSLMLVYVGIQLTNYLIEVPWAVANSTYPATRIFTADYRLPLIWPGTLVNAGGVIALVAAAAMGFLVFRTTFGLWLRAIGGNARASEVIGLPNRPMIVAAMALSGAFAGLGGAIEVLGVRGRLLEGFSPGYGFEAIAIALLGRMHPVGIIGTALFFGVLDAGAAGLQVASPGVSSAIAPIIEALSVIFLLAALGLIAWLDRRKMSRRVLNEAKA
jgi:simple sugar transport system permease protein